MIQTHVDPSNAVWSFLMKVDEDQNQHLFSFPHRGGAEAIRVRSDFYFRFCLLLLEMLVSAVKSIVSF